MIEKLRDLNEVLPEIILVDLVYLLVGTLIIVILVPNPLYYIVGLLAGVLYAIGCVFHMSFQIRKVVYGSADKMSYIAGSVSRMGMTVVVCAILSIFNIGDVICAIIGMFSMKISAYICPFVCGVTSRISKKGG